MADAKRIFSISELGRPGASVRTAGATPARFEWDALRSRTAPMGIWEFAVELRTVREDYAGAEEPVEQVLGWHYTNFTVKGRWDDRYAGTGYAVATWQAFEEMVKRGNLVEIEFQSVNIVGLIKKGTFKYRREAFIEYEFEVSPHYRHHGDSVRDTTVPPRQADPTDILKGLQTNADLMQAASEDVDRFNVDSMKDVEDQLGITQTLGAAYAALNNARSFLEEGTSIDVPGLRRLSAAIGAVRVAQFDTALLVGALSVEANALQQRPLVQLGFEAWVRGIAAAARTATATSYDAQRALAIRAQPDAKAVYRTRENEHIYAISQQFYGNIGGWRAIMDANGLTSSVMTGTELLVIPEIANQ